LIDWTKFDCLRCSYTAKHQQLHSLHSDTGAQIQGQIAGLLQQSLPNASTVRTYQSILILATYQCYWTHFVIYDDDYLFFFPPRYVLKGSGWLGQHNNFSSLFRDKNSLLTWCLCKFCAFPAAWNSLMNLETSKNCCQSDAVPPYADFVV